LRTSLDRRLPAPDLRLRRWRRRSYDQVIAVDRAAFDEFWTFDAVALDDALAATPVRTLRVTRTDPVQGYHLSGVSGTRGYLQRLAVHPDASGHGVGTALLADALRWMRTRGALEAYVNTQQDNERALALYHRAGFTDCPEDLVVMERSLRT
jgi:ribosomal protein S18 acetylase RimI-like enzyme